MKKSLKLRRQKAMADGKYRLILYVGSGDWTLNSAAHRKNRGTSTVGHDTSMAPFHVALQRYELCLV